MRRCRAIAWLLAVLLFAQAGLAAAHCLSGLGGGLAIELCTADGLRHTVLPDLDGERHDTAAGFCAGCAGPQAVALPPPPALPPPGGGALGAAPAGGEHAFVLPAARAPPYRATAPPAFA